MAFTKTGSLLIMPRTLQHRITTAQARCGTSHNKSASSGTTPEASAPASDELRMNAAEFDKMMQGALLATPQKTDVPKRTKTSKRK